MRLPILLPVMVGALTISADTPPLVKLMLDQLQRQNALVLVVLEPPVAKKKGELMAPATGFEQSLRKVLRSETLADLTIEVVPLGAPETEPVAGWVRTSFDPGGPRAWVLIDAQGRCLAKGTEAPRPERLAEQLAGQGIQGPTRKLRAFLRLHPSHLEARCALMKELRKISERRTRALLKVETKTLQEDMREGKFRFSLNGLRIPDLPKDVRSLAPEEDVLLWAAYANEVDRIFKEGRWQEAELAFQDLESLPLERYSPLMQEVYRRHLPLVEAALEARPTSSDLWGVWSWMARVLGERPVRQLLARLAPVPEAFRDTPWPPRALRDLLVKEARGASDWSGLKEVLQPHWEEQRDLVAAMKGNRGVQAGGGLQGMLEEGYETIGEPLLEALLRTGDVGAAESLGSEVLGWEWEPAPARLAALARRCNHPELATRWAAARPAAK